MTVINYTPGNWYWIVAGSTSQVWASARISYVPITDSAYVTWLSDGNLPSRINSPTELYAVLLTQWLPGVVSAGCAVTSTATPALNGTYALDQPSLFNITSLSAGIAAGKPLPGGGTTFNYPDISSAQHAFTGANFLDFAAAIETLIYSAQQALAALLAGTSAAFPALSVTIA